jgi:hypothetical protein
MSVLTEPDDVELFVGGLEPDAGAAAETARLIEEYKKWPPASRASIDKGLRPSPRFRARS